MNGTDDASMVAEKACTDLKNVLKENLASCILYGSAVRGDMIPGKSDTNLLVVLNHSAPETHRAIAHILKDSPQVVPFVLSKWELPRSCKVFALKFLNIKRFHKLLHGEDVLKDFNPSPTLIQFLCEQSLRNLRLRLKHAYIRMEDKPTAFLELMVRQSSSMIVTLSEILRCLDLPVPQDLDDRATAIGRALDTDASVLSELRKLKRNPEKLSGDEVFQLHSRVYMLLSAALDKVRQQWPEAMEKL